MPAVTPRQSMLIAGIVQGLALIALHEWFKATGFGPEDLPWATPVYTFVIVAPMSFGFLRGEFSAWRSAAGALAVAIPVTAAGIWVGWTRSVGGHLIAGTWFDEHLVAFAASVLAVFYLALPFVQAVLRGNARELPYDRLFNDAWRNTLLLGNCASFTGIFWVLLALWAGLFHIIGIRFFQIVFTNWLFINLATTLTVSAAISLESRDGATLEALKRHLLTFQTRLLPLAGLIVILFLCALPFSGLQPLWETGHATPLMLGLQGCVLVLSNAVWEDGHRPSPFSPPVRLLVRASLVLLPVLAGLCAWSLSLRVTQYGWTSDRVWAAALVVLVAFYAIGYACCALRHGWLPGFGIVNRALVLLTIGLLLALHTPLLDPSRIAASSQLSRLLAGDIDPMKFDFSYLRFELGRSGQEALDTLATLSDHPKAADIRAHVKDTLAKKSRFRGSGIAPEAGTIAQRLKAFPAGIEVPRAFIDHLHERMKTDPVDYNLNGLRGGAETRVLFIDLGGDQSPEAIIMFPPYPVFGIRNGTWQQLGTINFAGRPPGKAENLLERGDHGTQPHEWKDLRLGDTVGTLVPANPSAR